MKFYNNDNKYGIQSDIKDFFFIFKKGIDGLYFTLH